MPIDYTSALKLVNNSKKTYVKMLDELIKMGLDHRLTELARAISCKDFP